MTKRPESPWLRSRAEAPLDDGPRDGTEHWREMAGVGFCHWDRWLLTLALTERDGLRGIARQFRERARSGGSVRETAEALHAQAVDLSDRLSRLELQPADVLDQVERSSKWLHEKASRRVWHASSIRETAAMRRTPRAVLRQRALCGNWNSFDVPPDRYAAELAALLRSEHYDYRTTGSAVELLHAVSRRMILAAPNDAHRMAVHRAALTVSIDAMEKVDDSLAEMAEFFRMHEQPYLELVIACARKREPWADLLELVIWEDYGLFHKIDDFLRNLLEPVADVAIRELARIISELGRAELDYQLGKARRLRATIVSSANEATGANV